MIAYSPEQKRAIEADDDRILLLAAAGAGKTSVLLERAVRLSSTGDRVLGLTFTRRAAAMLKGRLGVALPDNLNFYTIHAYCALLLRRHHEAVGLPKTFRILDDYEQLQLGQEAAHVVGVKPGKKKLETLLENPALRSVYTRLLRNNGMVDYADLEEMTLRHLASGALDPQVDHLLVDEYQDVSRFQARIIEAIKSRTFFAVGSREQAIYSWRGATPEVMDEEAANPATRIMRLSINYRGSKAVVRTANALAGLMELPEAARLGDTSASADAPDGDVVDGFTENDADQNERMIADLASNRWWTQGSVIVIGRTWRDIDRLQQILPRAGIPVRSTRDAMRAWKTNPVRGIRDVFRSIAWPDDTGALHRVLALCGVRDIAKATTGARAAGVHPLRFVADRTPVDAIREKAEAVLRAADQTPTDIIDALAPLFLRDDYAEVVLRELRAASLRTAAEAADWILDATEDAGAGINFDPDQPGEVVLLTAHGAKGTEADYVYVHDVSQRRWPPPWSDRTEQTAEELRLLYVACTRARRRLYVSGWTRGQRFGRAVMETATAAARNPFDLDAAPF